MATLPELGQADDDLGPREREDAEAKIRAAEEPVDEIDRRVVGPVQVFDEEDERALLRANEGLERHAQARLHELSARARRAQGLVGVVGEGDADELADERREEAQGAREPRRHVGADLVDLVLRRIAVVHAHERAQGPPERREAPAAAHRIAATEQHFRATRGELEPLHQLGSDAALADPGGAGDERGARRAVLHELGEDALEQGDFFLAAHRRRRAPEELARAEAARVLAQEHAALRVFLHDEAPLDRRGRVGVEAHRAGVGDLELPRRALQRLAREVGAPAHRVTDGDRDARRGDGVGDGEAGPRRAHGLVALRSLDAEHGDHAPARERLEARVVAEHVAHRGVDVGRDLRAAEIVEHDGDDAPLAGAGARGDRRGSGIARAHRRAPRVGHRLADRRRALVGRGRNRCSGCRRGPARGRARRRCRSARSCRGRWIA